MLRTCGIEDGANVVATFATLVRSIRLKLPKGVANAVELKTFASSPQATQLFGEAIFGLIKTTQAEIVASYIAGAMVQLDDDTERLQKAKDLVGKAGKLGSAIGATYLSTWDEIRFLLDEIARSVLKFPTKVDQLGSSHPSKPVRLPLHPKNG